MTQTAFRNSASSTAFDFFKDADNAIITYLGANAPNSLSAYLVASGTTFRREIQEHPYTDDSTSRTPICHVWSHAWDGDNRLAQICGVKVQTRLLVWVHHSDPETALAECKNVAGAIASAIQQSNDVTTGDWSTFYLTTIKDQPEVRLSESTWNQTEELGGWASARIDATWHHHE